MDRFIVDDIDIESEREKIFKIQYGQIYSEHFVGTKVFFNFLKSNMDRFIAQAWQCRAFKNRF